ncbi:MAG: B12-binding domain-containing radical SAM protein [Candidatus Anammoxibacter sp.]
MKLHIIQPTTYTGKGKLFQTRSRWVLGLTLPYLAGLTADSAIDVKLTDERLQSIDFKQEYDLVAITVMTRSAKRAYEISRTYRDMGIKVVMGGFHVSFNPDEAKEHCDAIFMGEAENTWKEMLTDFKSGTLKGIYESSKFHDLQNLPFPRYDLLDLSKYKVKFLPVQTSRGCPFACNFCEVSHMYGRKYRFRPQDEVIDEIKRSKLKRVQFIDDNFAANREYTLSLLKRLAPLKIKWTCLWTIKNSLDEDLVEQAKTSGCYHINMGIESINEKSIKDMGKSQNKVSDYIKSLSLLNKKKIFYSLNFIFGWDSDEKSTFRETLNFINKNKVPLAFFSMLFPQKGTKIYQILKKEDRIISGNPFNGMKQQCIFKPKNMTTSELESGMLNIYRRFYSIPSIIRRVILVPRTAYIHIFLSNFIFRRASKMLKSPLDYY